MSFLFDRYVYKFVCDLQALLGYNPEQLQEVINLQSGIPSSNSGTGPGSVQEYKTEQD